MEKLNVVIVDDNPLIPDILDESIDTEDRLSVTGKADNGADAINIIIDITSDIVLLDSVMPRVDGIFVVEKVKNEHTFLKNPTFIILSTVGGEQVTEDAFRTGANYYLTKPFDKEILVNKIRYIGKLSDKQSAGKVLTISFEPREESYIIREKCMREHPGTNTTKMFRELGIPTHIKGYQYPRDTITMPVEDQEVMNNVTKIPYPTIAKRSQTTASRVEHAIHHAIKVAWGRGKMETIDEVFGYITSTGKGKPTDSELIALISGKILLEYKRI